MFQRIEHLPFSWQKFRRETRVPRAWILIGPVRTRWSSSPNATLNNAHRQTPSDRAIKNHVQLLTKENPAPSKGWLLLRSPWSTSHFVVLTWRKSWIVRLKVCKLIHFLKWYARSIELNLDSIGTRKCMKIERLLCTHIYIQLKTSRSKLSPIFSWILLIISFQ